MPVGSDPRPGGEIAGYRLEELLGRGGMGAVYRAEDVRLGRRVALKILAPELAENERFRERFLRESQLAASLDHPHIVPIYAAGEAAGQLYLVMRFVEGYDLRQLLTREGRLTPERAVMLVGQVGDALDAAHEHGLIHRDVKPGNVLIASRAGREHCYLADFGLTKQTGSISGLTGTGELVGTVAYVSPEQIRGEPVDARADVYALGCVFYECLAGDPPFERETEVATLWAHVNEPPPPLSAARPELGRGIDQVFMRALAKGPGERFTTSAELVGAAREALGLAERSAPRALPRRRQRRLTLPHGRLRPLVAGVVLAGIIAAAVGIAIFALGGDEPSRVNLGEQAGNLVGIVDTGSGDAIGAVEAPAPPTAMAAGLGYVWSASADSNSVFVVDAATNTVRQTIPVESAPGGIAIGGGSVWVTNSLTGAVSQISPQTLDVVQTIPVGNGPSGIAARNGHVWVANTSDHTVSKLRASDGKPLGTFDAGSDPGAVALGAGAVWIASKLAGTVAKLSPSTGEVLDRIPVGDGPAAVAVGAGSVWVANSLAGTVSRIDPQSGSVRATLEVGSSADALAVAGGDVWVASGLAGKLSRIDARGGRVTAIDVGNRPTALAAADGSLYVGLRPSGASHVGGTLRVVFPGVGAGPVEIDPANAYTPNGEGILALTNDGLVGWKRVGGQAGAELVPDLAVSLPSDSEDRRTYTFQLRPGIRYSDGRLVRASDVRYSLERVYKLRPTPDAAAFDFYRAIVGADRCSERPSRCDLSRGIETDDRAGTVAFHLSTPDPDFLFKLTLPFAHVVPTGTPLQEAVQRPLPATGPYRVASVSPGRSLRLVRNPRFREWSSAAQPAGFPDEIVVSLVSNPARRARLVARGKADWTSFLPGQPLPVPPVHRPQLRAQPVPRTNYLVFDATRPPFDDVRARRAVNYALDRNKVIRFVGGSDAGRPTCQLLPPNFPGYRGYCPYTLDPGAGAGWTEPDLVEARRLVAASGTKGARVELWWPAFYQGEQAGVYVEELLDSLGYRARLRTFPAGTDLNAYFSAVMRPGASWQIAGSGWIADYPAASNFINILSCSSAANLGHFCDRALDAKIRRALRVQERRPAAAKESWAAIDRQLTDQAALGFLYTSYSADFVSKRVGNYQHHPVWGALFGQLWVR